MPEQPHEEHSSEQLASSPLVNTEDAPAPAQLPAQDPVSHQHRASLDNIVFGSMQDSSAAPSTPHEPAHRNNNIEQPLPRHPPGLGAPQYAPAFQPAHSQQPSDTQLQWSIAGPTTIQANGTHEHTHGSHQYPLDPSLHGTANGQYPSAPGPVVPSVAMRPDSRSTLKSHGDSDRGRDLYVPPQMNGSGPAHLPTAPPQAPPPELMELTHYLSNMFANPELADYLLVVRNKDSYIFQRPVHSLMVARSPVVLSAIQNLGPSSRRQGNLPVVELSVPDQYGPFISQDALHEGLKIIYGGPLQHVDSFIYRLEPYHLDAAHGPATADARHRMSNAISYAAVGAFLKLDMMRDRGLELVRILLRWDTFDLALAYSVSTNPALNLLPNRLPAGQELPMDMQNESSLALAREVMEFLAFNLPANFAFSASAPEFKQLPRLPDLSEKLSKLRLGGRSGHPMDTDRLTDYVTTILSSVLRNLPQYLVDRLFNHPAVVAKLGWERSAGLLVEVVRDRERARDVALHELQTLRKNGIDPGSVPELLRENLFWREEVLSSPSDQCGYTLTSTRLDVNF